MSGLLTRMFEQRFHPSADPPAWVSSLSGWDTAAGARVDPQSALQVVAVLACVRVISETLASLPLVTYRRLKPRGKERAPDHHLYSLLHDAPNPEMTSMELREAVQAHACTWGNGFAEIDIDGAGRAQELWPLRPDRMQIQRNKSTRRLEYVYRLPDKVGGFEVVLQKERVLHLRGMGFDGIVGYSPIQLARQAIGLALATEEFGARFFGNGATPGLVLTHPQKLSKEAHDRLKESWEERHQGLERSHRIAILEEGLKTEKIGIPPEDAQFLVTRQFQVTEIARLFRVQPHKIADLTHATFSNIEHQGIEHVVDTVRPWAVRWEQCLLRDVFLPGERKDFFAEHLLDGLLRGDQKSRYDAYAVGRMWGWLSADDVLELENRNPLPKGKGQGYYIPLNMIPVGASAGERVRGHSRKRPALELRSAALRQRVMLAHRPMLRDAGERIVLREIEELRQGAAQALADRNLEDFSSFLDRYYRQDLEALRDEMRGPVGVYADAMAAAAGDEIGGWEKDEVQLDRFVQQYIESFAVRHAASTVGQMRSVAQEAVAAGLDPLEALEERFGEWDETGPDKLADWETNQAGNAVARFVFVAVGVIKLRWATSGDSCPYCSKLNGKIVGTQAPFLPAGVDFQPDGAAEALRPSVNVFHPPAHGGCDCLLMPEL